MLWGDCLRLLITVHKNILLFLNQNICCGETADPRVTSSIQARSCTFVDIDHEIISTATLLPSTDLRRVVVNYKQKYVHEVLVNRLVKFPKKKVWSGELTIPT